MKIKPSRVTSLTNKKTTPPTIGKISKPKSFKAKSKTTSSKLTSTPSTPKKGKKELTTNTPTKSARRNSSKKNRKISPELNLGLKIEKILENGGPNVIKLNSESETPKTSVNKKKEKTRKEETDSQTFEKKVKGIIKEDSNDSEVSNKNNLSTIKPKKKKRPGQSGNNEIHNQQEGKKKMNLMNRRKQLPHSEQNTEIELGSSGEANKVMYLNCL